MEEEQLQNREHEEQSNITSSTKRSWVWDHYTFDEHTKKAQCNYCKAFISTSKGSTSGMSSHIKSQHGITKDSERQDERQDERQGGRQGRKQVERQRSIEIAVSLILNF